MPGRGYVNFNPDNETILLINNFGGLSPLEMGALVNEALEQPENNWNIEPVRVCAGFLETSLNAPAFSVSVINATAAANNCRYSVDDIKGFFDAKTNTHWDSMAGSHARRRSRREQLISPSKKERKTVGQEQSQNRRRSAGQDASQCVQPARRGRARLDQVGHGHGRWRLRRDSQDRCHKPALRTGPGTGKVQISRRGVSRVGSHRGE